MMHPPATMTAHNGWRLGFGGGVGGVGREGGGRLGGITGSVRGTAPENQVTPAPTSRGGGGAAPDGALAGAGTWALTGGALRAVSCRIGSSGADGGGVAEAAGLWAAVATGRGSAGGTCGVAVELGAGALPTAPSLEAAAEAAAGGNVGDDVGTGGGGGPGTGAGTPQGVVGAARTLAASW
jgi:hypothetical protein